MTKRIEMQKLHKAISAICLQAGTDTSETVEWLCGPYGGMSKLFSAYFGGGNANKSFGEVFPKNHKSTCKCEHWQMCSDCRHHVLPKGTIE